MQLIEKTYILLYAAKVSLSYWLFSIKGCQRRMSHHEDDASFDEEDIQTSDHGLSF